MNRTEGLVSQMMAWRNRETQSNAETPNNGETRSNGVVVAMIVAAVFVVASEWTRRAMGASWAAFLLLHYMSYMMVCHYLCFHPKRKEQPYSNSYGASGFVGL